jgi:hypothetical protein
MQLDNQSGRGAELNAAGRLYTGSGSIVGRTEDLISMVGTVSPLSKPAAQIAEWLRLFIAPGQVTELRILEATTSADRWPQTEAGYFDEMDALARAAVGIKSALGFYFIPTPLKPALLARAVNKIRKAPKGESTADGDILRRHWLLIDTDPVRPAGIASSDEEHKAALDRAAAIDAYLTANGWPFPIKADSGNGGQLIYRIDLPADDAGLVQRCLVQCTSRPHLAKREKKVRQRAEVAAWLRAGGLFECWECYRTPVGKWKVDRIAIQAETVEPVLLTSRRRRQSKVQRDLFDC